MIKMTLAVALFLGLVTAAQRYSQQAARYNPLPSYYSEDPYAFLDELYADSGYYEDEEEEDQWMSSPYYRPEVRAMVQMELGSALSDKSWWKFLPQKKQEGVNPFINLTSKIGN